MIGFAARQDYRSFFESEFRRRRTGLYPPFTMMVRLLAESSREDAAENAARELEQETRRLLDEHPAWMRKTLLVMYDAPSVKVLRGKHRRHVLMKLLVSREADELIEALTMLAGEEKKDAGVWLEVNPTTMM